ncbi:MAG: TIGR00269 family protein [Candidatus Micrarchaeota archaeon]
MASCDKCGKRAGVNLHYTDTDLCEACFCAQFERRVSQANKDFKMLRLGDKVAVGVSGGKDSGAMLYVLKKMSPSIRGLELIPITIDEGIDSYRIPSIKCAQELCDTLGLPLATYRYCDYFKPMDDVVKIRNRKSKSGKLKNRRSCTYCGVFRRALLDRASRELGAGKLAIGHNADDVAQTFLMNLLRRDEGKWGAFSPASDGYGGFVPRIKPLIYNPEAEALLYCKFKGIPYYECKCPYSSESFRGEVKRFLNRVEEGFPGAKFNLLQSYLSLQEKMDGGAVKGKHTSTCRKCGMPSSGKECMACTLKGELDG